MNGTGVESLKAFMAEHPDYLVIDHSQLEKWEQCPSKYEYIYRHNLACGASPEAEFSSLLIHAPLGAWYESGGRIMPTTTMWQENWSKFSTKVLGSLNIRQTSLLTLNMAKSVFSTYVSRFGQDFESYQFIHSEVVYWRELPDVKAVWLSKPDLVLKRKTDGALVSTDFKVSSWDIQENLLSFDRQFLGQAWTCGAKYMMKNFIHLQTGRERGPQINREFEAVDEDLLGRWVQEQVESIRMVEHNIETGIFPKRAPRACYDFNKVCPFMDLCLVASARDIMIQEYPTANTREYLGL